MALHQVQHPPRPAAAGAALGVTADRTLLIEKGDRLLQHRFRKAQLGVGVAEVVHQRRGIAVAIEQALQDPADRQLQAQVLDRRLLEEGVDHSQAGTGRGAARSHRRHARRTLSTW